MKRFISTALITGILGMIMTAMTACSDTSSSGEDVKIPESTKSESNSSQVITDDPDDFRYGYEGWDIKCANVCSEGSFHYACVRFPMLIGHSKLGGYISSQPDGTVSLISACNDSVWTEGEVGDVPEVLSTVNSIENVFPAYSELVRLTISSYLHNDYTYTSDFNMEVLNKEIVAINGYDMCKYNGVMSYKDYKGVEYSRDYVAYAVQLKQCHNELVYFMSFEDNYNEDDSIYYSKEDVKRFIEEDALYMAKSFYEEDA